MITSIDNFSPIFSDSFIQMERLANIMRKRYDIRRIDDFGNYVCIMSDNHTVVAQGDYNTCYRKREENVIIDIRDTIDRIENEINMKIRKQCL